MKPEQRTKVVSVIRCLWASLDSHLDFSVQEDKKCDTCGDRKFQAKTVAEYAEAIKNLSDLLR